MKKFFLKSGTVMGFSLATAFCVACLLALFGLMMLSTGCGGDEELPAPTTPVIPTTPVTPADPVVNNPPLPPTPGIALSPCSVNPTLMHATLVSPRNLTVYGAYTSVAPYAHVMASNADESVYLRLIANSNGSWLISLRDDFKRNEIIFVTVRKEGCQDVLLMLPVKLLPEVDNNVPPLPNCAGIDDSLFQATLSPKEIVAWSWQGGVPPGMIVTLCDGAGFCSNPQVASGTGQFILSVTKDNTSSCGNVFVFVLGNGCLSAFYVYLTPPPFSGG